MAKKIGELAAEYLVQYGFQVLGGLIILAVGFKIAGWVSGTVEALCHKRKLDVTLSKFLAMAVKGIILVFVGLMAVEKFGVTVSPLIASVGALIFGASFAIQAPLSNYAAGLMIILTRPYVVGNTITVQGVTGVVHEVKLPCTILHSEDGERITIPNKEMVGQILWNSAEYKVVERTVGISYSSDPERAVRAILGVLEADSRVAKNPAPQVGIDSFGESSIDVGLRYWVPTREYHSTLYGVNLEVHRALKQAGVSIPFPQREVRLLR